MVKVQPLLLLHTAVEAAGGIASKALGFLNYEPVLNAAQKQPRVCLFADASSGFLKRKQML
jgi:hypothetical protein